MLDLALCLGVQRRCLEPSRVARVRPCELAYRGVERRREEHRLARLRHPADDAIDLRLEAHVEHAVGLVEDEDLHAVERDGLPLEQVVEAARGRDEHVGVARALRLSVQGNAAVDGRDRDPVRRDRLQLAADLGGELTGRNEHDRSRPTIAGLDALDDRDREGQRLARARRGLGKDVTPGERVAEDLRLDWKGCRDVALGERTHDARGHAELGEGLLHFDSTPCLAWSRSVCLDRSKEEPKKSNLTGRRRRPCLQGSSHLRAGHRRMPAYTEKTPDEYRRRRLRPPYPFMAGGDAVATLSNELPATEQAGVEHRVARRTRTSARRPTHQPATDRRVSWSSRASARGSTASARLRCRCTSIDECSKPTSTCYRPGTTRSSATGPSSPSGS